MGAKFESRRAEIINDKANELIAWQTVGGIGESAGSVRFESIAGGSTMVRVSLQYSPPGGELGHMLTALLGEDPGARIKEA